MQESLIGVRKLSTCNDVKPKLCSNMATNAEGPRMLMPRAGSVVKPGSRLATGTEGWLVRLLTRVSFVPRRRLQRKFLEVLKHGKQHRSVIPAQDKHWLLQRQVLLMA